MKCKNCSRIMGHTLKQSGFESPKDLICPVCNEFHDGFTGLRTKDVPVKSVPVAPVIYDQNDDEPDYSFPYGWI